jgi:threonine dehydrogenase-like Zn-dependent dehydrogenase
VRVAGGVALVDVAPPVPAPDEVLIEVAWAGICRTDVDAARGRLRVPEGGVIGHEFSGIVVGRGSRVTNIALGAPVGVMPLGRCGSCAGCAEGGGGECSAPWMLGLDRPGAYAEQVAVPAAQVHALPPTIALRSAAYLEPLAAALAVLNSGIAREQRGAVFGENRIATLTLRVLSEAGFSACAAASRPIMPGELDFAVEASPSARVIAEALRALKHRGTLVVKSRPSDVVPLDLAVVVKKEVRIVGAAYAPFADAIRWLSERPSEVLDLFGEDFALEEHAQAFDLEERDGRRKRFFRLQP